MFFQNVVNDTDPALLPSLKAMAKNAVDGLSITDGGSGLPQSSQQSLSQQQLQQTATPQPTSGPVVGSSNISQSGIHIISAMTFCNECKQEEVSALHHILLRYSALSGLPEIFSFSPTLNDAFVI